MRIGFDISQTGSGKAGCGYFAHAMIKALGDIDRQNTYKLFPSFGDFYFDSQMPIFNPYDGENFCYGPRHISRDTAAQFWNNPNLEVLLNGVDVIHANNFWSPLNLSSTRLVYTLYDMNFSIEPNWTTEANRVGCFDGVFRASLAADWIVAISEASKVDYLNTFPHFPEELIKVIYPCSRFTHDSSLGLRPNALENIKPQQFWLSVGTIEPRKNQRRLAQSYAHYLRLGGVPYPLIFAGGKGWLMEDFEDYLLELGIREHVVLTGYVSDDELIWLYRNCYANLYPSLFEGFGLPVLEGMQFGASTITSNTSSIPEVVGDAAILLDPSDVESWGQLMLNLSKNSNQRDLLKKNSLEQAKKFNWERSANALLEVYRAVLAKPKRSNQIL